LLQGVFLPLNAHPVIKPRPIHFQGLLMVAPQNAGQIMLGLHTALVEMCGLNLKVAMEASMLRQKQLDEFK
jgi:hypothetical protein